MFLNKLCELWFTKNIVSVFNLRGKGAFWDLRGAQTWQTAFDKQKLEKKQMSRENKQGQKLWQKPVHLTTTAWNCQAQRNHINPLKQRATSDTDTGTSWHIDQWVIIAV